MINIAREEGYSTLLQKCEPYVFLYNLCFYQKVNKYFKCVITNQTDWSVSHVCSEFL